MKWAKKFPVIKILFAGPKAEAGIKPSSMAIQGSRKLGSSSCWSSPQTDRSSGKDKVKQNSKGKPSKSTINPMNSNSKADNGPKRSTVASCSDKLEELSDSEPSTTKKRRIVIVDSDDEMDG